MRLVSIGHASARFSDVTLNFTDRQGRPTHSVLWLRNGGGKTSLLNLFFAGVRPNKREFLGQRADEKIRSIDDYVGPRDHGVVVCEWELDAERSLFDEHAPQCLTGVFYQRSASHDGNGKPGVDRLFFGMMVSPSVSELSLEGLPIFADDETERHRRTLSGFRRRLNQLDSAHPQQNVFHTDKQHKFEEELSSRGVDPVVFSYQIHMNEREGGVSERFSFSEDEEFVDFLLEMAFSRQRAQDVRDHLSTFRQELMERNEQLKPELEYCRGLMPKLGKLEGVHRQRAALFQEMSTTRQRLVGLKSWVSNRTDVLDQKTGQLQDETRSCQAGAAEVVRLTADAVQYAHEHGVIHRDLKPRNILVDAADQPRVSDFGLAKNLRAETDLTATGKTLGTPAYMPPEHAQAAEAGPLADVYSLGATLYCLLTGRPPFQAATSHETMLQVVEREPVAPRLLNPDVPKDLETICLKCLRKEQSKRYPSAASLAEDLGHWLNHEPILARPVTKAERCRLWCKRRPGVASLLATILVLAIVGAVAVQ